MINQDSLEGELKTRSFVEGFECGMLSCVASYEKPGKYLEGLLKRQIPYHKLADLVKLSAKLASVSGDKEVADVLERSLEASLYNFVNHSDKPDQ